MVCKLFKETDVSSVPIGSDYDRPRTQYRSMLSTVYLYSARNMATHYAEFNPTSALLDEKNCRNLLKILFDLKERIEIDITLNRFATRYKYHVFFHKEQPPSNVTEDDFKVFLEKLWKVIQKKQVSFIKAISESKEMTIHLIKLIIFQESFYQDRIDIPVYRELNEMWNKRKSFKNIHRKINKKDTAFITKCLEMLVNGKSILSDFISKSWKEHNFAAIKDVFNRISSQYNSIYIFCTAKQDKEQEAYLLIEKEIESWKFFFEWKSTELDLMNISNKLDKIDYFEKGFKNIVSLDALQDKAKQGQFDSLTQELSNIANKVSSHILFKDLYENIPDESNHFDLQTEDYSYYWNRGYIERSFEAEDIDAMIHNLKIIEDKTLINEDLWPYDTESKKNFIEYLSKINGRIQKTFNDKSLLDLARKISTEANDIKKIWDNRTVDERSLNVFKDDKTYGLAIMEKCKALLLQTICYTTASNKVREKLKSKNKELLDKDGKITIGLSYNFRKSDDSSNDLFNEIKYDDRFKEDARIFLDYIFGVTNVYNKTNGSHGGTLFDIYGYKIFLYLIKVTFAMNQKTETSY